MDPRIKGKIDRLKFKEYELIIGYPKVYNYFIVLCYAITLGYLALFKSSFQIIIAAFLMFGLMLLFQMFHKYKDVVIYKNQKLYRLSLKPTVKDNVADCKFKRSILGKYYIVGPNIGKFHVLSINENKIIKKIIAENK